MGDAEAQQGRLDREFEIYKLMIETWKWQISSNWHRTDYFAAFQTALLFAAGKIVLDKPHWVGMALWAFALVWAFGFGLNLIWIASDWKAAAYTNYWRKAAERMEARVSLATECQFISKSEYEKKACDWGVRRPCPQYECLMWSVRMLFTGAWIAIGILAIVKALHR